jgi:hypothetical protein
MMPDTLHYVVTVDNSITYGQQTFPASLSQQIAMGIIHPFVLGEEITNYIYDNLNVMLRWIMSIGCITTHNF